jgi:phage terminase small subunit
MNNIELRDSPLKGLEIGPKLAACSEKERVFAYAYATGIAETAAAAARLAGYSDPGPHSNSLRSKAHQVLHRSHVIAAIEEVCRTEFRGLIPLTIAAAKRVLQDSEHDDHVKMIISLLSRLGYGEKTAVDVNVSGEVMMSHTDAAVEDLRRLKALGVPREKLLEIFGFSGLDRYQKMLDQRPKLIETKAESVDVQGTEAEPVSEHFQKCYCF